RGQAPGGPGRLQPRGGRGGAAATRVRARRAGGGPRPGRAAPTGASRARVAAPPPLLPARSPGPAPHRAWGAPHRWGDARASLDVRIAPAPADGPALRCLGFDGAVLEGAARLAAGSGRSRDPGRGVRLRDQSDPVDAGPPRP